MANLNSPNAPKTHPKDIIRQKMNENPKLDKKVSKQMNEISNAKMDIKPNKRGSSSGIIISIVSLVLFLGLTIFVVFVYTNFTSEIGKINDTLSNQDNTEIESQGDRIEVLENSLQDLKGSTETELSSLENQISGTEGFASKSSVDNLEKILKETDTDVDGLSDYEEVITYETDPNDRDTDKDGFTDKQEVDLGYNPAGTGKLETTSTDETEGETTEEKSTVKISTSNYTFSPTSFEVEAGKTVRVELSSIEGDHTFTIDKLNVDQEIEEGGEQIVEFTPEEAGEYTYYSNTSDDIENNMEGTMTVNASK